MKVICDINVWYAISQHGINISSELRKHELYITNLSLFELISSRMLKSNFETVQQVIFSITKYSSEIFSQNDAQQIILAQKPDYIDSLALTQKDNIYKLIDSFCKADKVEDLDFNYDYFIQVREQETVKWGLIMKELVNELRINRITEYDVIKIRTSEILIQHVKWYLSQNSPSTIIENYFLDKFEFFLDCYSLYLLEFIKKPKKVFDMNDYIDFMNLLYCTNGYKYFTLESEKRNRLGAILRDSKFSDKYLLPNDSFIKEQINRVFQQK
ncbi:MAG: hypothetical protein COW65_15020 [Cytophagales bacterium CG18_big_fil_WC_8_21_14_2_50_42_9]|nr:MAG: hypothetical protein COW65_15020 [Cytophagales bacterium CG18_big_fil_WC_8_21_14_2_50_42_9]